MPKPKNALTKRQRRVVDYFFGKANLQKTAALRLGGYSCPEKQHSFFDRPAVKREMRKREAAFAKRYEVTYERVRDEIAKIAYFNPYCVLSVDEKTGMAEVDITQVDAAEMAAIGEIKVKKTRVQDGKDEDGNPVWVEVTQVFVKPWNKLKALDNLMKHAGLSKAKDPLADALNLADRITAAREQVGGADGDD